jgi:tripeptidyl-peptidase I
MYWLSVLSILTAVTLGLANPAVSLWDDMRVKHAWATAPERWDCLGHPPAGTTIDLRIALKPHHEDALVNALYEVSDPKHPKYVSIPSSMFSSSRTCSNIPPRRYGAHLSKEEVAKLVAPHPDTLELVTSWLARHGVPSTSVSITHGGNWLTIPAVPLDQANTLLGASYQLYRHVETNETVLRTIGYALPNALFGHIQTVAPTTYFGSPRALRQTSKVRTNGPTLPQGDLELQKELANANSPSLLELCSTIITPSCLRAMYNTSTYEPSATAQNQLGIAGYLGEFASQQDLKEFMLLFRADAARADFTVEQVNGGGNDQSNPGAEVCIMHIPWGCCDCK